MTCLWFVIDGDYRKYPYDAVDELDAIKQHEAHYGDGSPRAMNVQYACKATSVHWADMCMDLQCLKAENAALESRLSDIAEEG